MTRFLDWLDESAAGLIRVAYLLAGVIAVASYFSDGNVPKAFSSFLNTILPWALAGALEIHTYLTARRVRQAWQDFSASAIDSDEHERAGAQMKLNIWILTALLLFSMYNQLQYLAATWTPPHTPLTPPGPWAYIIRAIITPAAFMAAAFLAPVGEGLAVQVQSQAHALAVATFKVATQQWKQRLRQMQQTGQDVTGALVQLVDDPAERRVIEAIWQAMQHPGELPAHTAPTMPQQHALQGAQAASEPHMGVSLTGFEPSEESHHSHASEARQHALRDEAVSSIGEDEPTKPPTGPGSPSVAGSNPRTKSAATAKGANVTPLRSTRPARQTRRVAARANARSGKRGTAETRIRALLIAEPMMDFDELVSRAKVSRSTASKYVALVEAERANAMSATPQGGQYAQ